MSMICNAINTRAVLEFLYDGGARIVEPHCHGISRAGNEVLRAFQMSGASKSGNPTGWKLYEVSQISGARMTGATFAGTRPGYNPNDNHMTSIHCKV